MIACTDVKAQFMIFQIRRSYPDVSSECLGMTPILFKTFWPVSFQAFVAHQQPTCQKQQIGSFPIVTLAHNEVYIRLQYLHFAGIKRALLWEQSYKARPGALYSTSLLCFCCYLNSRGNSSFILCNCFQVTKVKS